MRRIFSDSWPLLKLESILHKRVIGQEEAVTAVAKAMRRGRVGLQDPGRFLSLIYRADSVTAALTASGVIVTR